MNEIWKDIPDYEGYYQVSNTGKVKSLRRSCLMFGRTMCLIPEKILKPSIVKYPIVILAKEGTIKYMKVHRLVAVDEETFNQTIQ